MSTIVFEIIIKLVAIETHSRYRFVKYTKEVYSFEIRCLLVRGGIWRNNVQPSTSI